MPITKEKRAEINRENAKKSTGPKTEESKERVRYNAFRHGLTGQVLIFPKDDFTAYIKHTDDMMAELAPKGTLEKQIAQTVSDTLGQIHRSHAYHHQLIAEQAIGREERYDENNNPQLNESYAYASVVSEKTKDLTNLSLCQHRAWRIYEKAYNHLMTLQQQRRAREVAEMQDAQELLALHEAEQEEKREAREKEAENAAKIGAPSPAPYVPVAYDPSQDGFVLQLTQITAHRDRQARLSKARKLHFDDIEDNSAAA